MCIVTLLSICIKLSRHVRNCIYVWMCIQCAYLFLIFFLFIKLFFWVLKQCQDKYLCFDLPCFLFLMGACVSCPRNVLLKSECRAKAVKFLGWQMARGSLCISEYSLTSHSHSVFSFTAWQQVLVQSLPFLSHIGVSLFCKHYSKMNLKVVEFKFLFGQKSRFIVQITNQFCLYNTYSGKLGFMNS